MKKIATPEDIKTCIRNTRTWFVTDTITDNTPKKFQRWSYNTRDNGDTQKEIPGQEDIIEARKLQKLLEDQFSNVRTNIETSEEWTNLEISLYPRKIQARPPTNLELYKVLAKKQNEITTRLERTGRWDKAKPRPSLQGNGLATLIFSNKAPNERIEINIQIQKQDEIKWTLFLYADDVKVPLKNLTPNAINLALSNLESITDGFFKTKNPTFLIARNDNGNLTYRRYKSYQGFTWVNNPSEATSLLDWEMSSYIKNAPKDPNLIFLKVTKGRETSIEPYSP